MIFRRRRRTRKKFSDKLVELGAEVLRNAGVILGHLLKPLDERWHIKAKWAKAWQWHLQHWNQLNGTQGNRTD